METQSPVTAIVYNRLNIEAVIATAMILSVTPEAQAFDVTQDAPLGSNTYYWVGVDPSTVPGFYQTLHGREHKVFVTEAPIRPLNFQLNPFKTKFPPLPEETHDDFVNRAPGIIDKVIEAFELQDPMCQTLAFHAAHFYDRDNHYATASDQMQWLAYVYKNVRHAEHCIQDHEDFEVQHFVHSDTERYFNDIRKVKNVFSSAYRHVSVTDGNVVRKAVQTSISDPHVFHLAKRLALLVHTNFINSTMGLSGPIVYSNMRHVQMDRLYGSPLLLN